MEDLIKKLQDSKGSTLKVVKGNESSEFQIKKSEEENEEGLQEDVDEQEIETNEVDEQEVETDEQEEVNESDESENDEEYEEEADQEEAYTEEDVEEEEEEQEEVAEGSFNAIEFSKEVFETREEIDNHFELLKENPELVEMLAFYKQTGSLLPYLHAATIDVDSFSDLDVLKAQFQAENSDTGLTQNQMDKLFEKEILSRYELDAEDEDDRVVAEARIKRDAAKFRKQMKEDAAKLRLPKNRDGEESKADAKKAADAAREQEANKNKMAFQIRKFVKDGKMEVKVGDESVKLPVSPKKLSSFIDGISDIKPFLDSEGDFDLRKVAMAIDPESFIKTISGNAETEGKKKFVREEMKNRKPKKKSPETKTRIEKVDPRDPSSWRTVRVIKR